MANTIKKLKSLDVEKFLSDNVLRLVNNSLFVEWGKSVMERVKSNAGVGLNTGDSEKYSISDLTTSIEINPYSGLKTTPTTNLTLESNGIEAFRCFRPDEKEYKGRISSSDGDKDVAVKFSSSCGIVIRDIDKGYKEFCIAPEDINRMRITMSDSYSTSFFIEGFINTWKNSLRKTIIGEPDLNSKDAMTLAHQSLNEMMLRLFTNVVLGSFSITLSVGNDFNPELIKIRFDLEDLSINRNDSITDNLSIINTLVGSFNASLRRDCIQENDGTYFASNDFLVNVLRAAHVSVNNLIAFEILPMIMKGE